MIETLGKYLTGLYLLSKYCCIFSVLWLTLLSPVLSPVLLMLYKLILTVVLLQYTVTFILVVLFIFTYLSKEKVFSSHAATLDKKNKKIKHNDTQCMN